MPNYLFFFKRCYKNSYKFLKNTSENSNQSESITELAQLFGMKYEDHDKIIMCIMNLRYGTWSSDYINPSACTLQVTQSL